MLFNLFGCDKQLVTELSMEKVSFIYDFKRLSPLKFYFYHKRIPDSSDSDLIRIMKQFLSSFVSVEDNFLCYTILLPTTMYTCTYLGLEHLIYLIPLINSETYYYSTIELAVN